jgi:hypothetical protein
MITEGARGEVNKASMASEGLHYLIGSSKMIEQSHNFSSAQTHGRISHFFGLVITAHQDLRT